MGFFTTVVLFTLIVAITNIIINKMKLKNELEKVKYEYLDRQLAHDVNAYNVQVLEGYLITQRAELARLEVARDANEKREILDRISITDTRIEDFKSGVNCETSIKTKTRADELKSIIQSQLSKKEGN